MQTFIIIAEQFCHCKELIICKLESPVPSYYLNFVFIQKVGRRKREYSKDLISGRMQTNTFIEF